MFTPEIRELSVAVRQWKGCSELTSERLPEILQTHKNGSCKKVDADGSPPLKGKGYKAGKKARIR